MELLLNRNAEARICRNAHAGFPDCLRFSFAKDKLEKSRKSSSPACVHTEPQPETKSPSAGQRFAPPICTCREQYEPPAPGKVMPQCRMRYQRKPVYRETVFGYLETKAAFRFSGRHLPSASLTKMIIRRIFPVVRAHESRSPSRCRTPHETPTFSRVQILSLLVFLVIERTIVLL